MSITTLVFALIAAAPLAGVPPPSFETDTEARTLAAEPLAAGHGDQALAMLEQASAADPHDAALLINLGIAYGQMGEEAKARAAFKAALACDDVVELDTAAGTVTNSRRLARKALKMLARGEFRAAQQRPYRN